MRDPRRASPPSDSVRTPAPVARYPHQHPKPAAAPRLGSEPSNSLTRARHDDSNGPRGWRARAPAARVNPGGPGPRPGLGVSTGSLGARIRVMLMAAIIASRADSDRRRRRRLC